MKAKPILFSTPMVQALLAGRKTQTRRVIKPQPEINKNEYFLWKTNKFFYGSLDGTPNLNMIEKCPYGKVGDLLYVRETIVHGGYEGAPIAYAADGKRAPFIWPSHWKRHCRPSIHMHRWASRLTLEITDIRVERLKDISEEDAGAEGVEFFKTGDSYGDDITYHFKDYLCKGIHADNDGEPIVYNNTFPDDAISSFKSLWSSINGKDSWEANPWVWVVEFKVHKCNVDDFIKQEAA